MGQQRTSNHDQEKLLNYHLMSVLYLSPVFVSSHVRSSPWGGTQPTYGQQQRALPCQLYSPLPVWRGLHTAPPAGDTLQARRAVGGATGGMYRRYRVFREILKCDSLLEGRGEVWLCKTNQNSLNSRTRVVVEWRINTKVGRLKPWNKQGIICRMC